MMAWLVPVEGLSTASSTCRRIPVAPGVEVLIDEQHPALRLNGDAAVVAEAFRQTLTSLVGLEPGSSEGGEQQSRVSEPLWSAVSPDSEMYDESAVGTERPE